MKTFQSQFADTVDDLVQMKDEAWRPVEDRRNMIDTIRKFSNGLATMTEEDAADLNREEIVNHLTTYAKLKSQETLYRSVVSGTNALAQVVVMRGNEEKDTVTGMRLSHAINQGAIHFKGKFKNFWKGVVGEIIMAGGVPTVFPPRYGWLPSAEIDMFFPPETPLDADEVPYAFVPREMTYADLKELLASAQKGRADYLDRDNLLFLITALQKQIKDQTQASSSFDSEVTRSVRNGDQLQAKHTTLDMWDYYEVKFRKDGTRYVSKTTFTDGLQLPTPEGMERLKEPDSSARIIAYVDEAYKDAFEWLDLVTLDSEIGGVQNTDTMRGIAELMYPSASEMEDLLNLTLEGDKIRARPKVKITSAAKPDSVAKWDIVSDLYAPDGVEEMQFKGTSQHLLTPFGVLNQTAASLTHSPMSNDARGGELRTQSIERQQSNGEGRVVNLNDLYTHLENILEVVVWRLLAGPTKPGTPGYQETMWVRKYLQDEGIDYETLAEREHGRFKYIRVRANRVVGNGDRTDQLETSDWMMNNIQNYPPASRPQILLEATALRTQDPDKAEQLVKVPQVLLNQQKVIAENEYDTIARRAAIGQMISISAEDIHNDHLNVHLLDMQSLLGKHQFEPWTMLDSLVFAGLIEHAGEHLRVLIGNPKTNFEGNQFLAPFQELVTQARPIMAELEQQQGQRGQLTAKEEADLQIKMAEMELKARDLGIKLADYQGTQQQRVSREALARRAQYTKEINDSKRFALEEKKLAKPAPSPTT